MERYEWFLYWCGRTFAFVFAPLRWLAIGIVVVYGRAFRKLTGTCPHDQAVLDWEPLGPFIWDRSPSTRTMRIKRCRACGIERSRPHFPT